MYSEGKKNEDRKTSNLLKLEVWLQGVVLPIEILSEVVSHIAEAWPKNSVQILILYE